MVHSADAARISGNLAQIGVEHYGHMLFHNFTLPTVAGLYGLDSVFGSRRQHLLSAINGKTKKVVTTVFGKNSPESQALDLREKAPCITSLYLYVLYKFRCEYFHGNINPLDRDNQYLAKAAFFSLRGLMEATVV